VRWIEIDFSRYSSIGIGPLAEVAVIGADDSLPDGYRLVGGANNILVSPSSPPPLAILDKEYSYARIGDGFVEMGGALESGRAFSFAKRHDLAGFEFMSGLPGTIGGMVAMNAGLKSHEIFSIVKSVEIDGEWIDADDIEYGYRFAKIEGVVRRVRFVSKPGYDDSLRRELSTLRKNQPNLPSAGSAFKNPPGDYAGRLIEAVGLRGERVGDMAFSEQHANFLVNLGRGTYEEAIYLLDTAKKRVKESFGIELREEIIILDTKRDRRALSIL
jgi:UDP-N-acetylmuramate dehydrogenase